MTSDHLIRLVCEDELESVIAAFIDDCQLAELSQRTIENYQGALSRFHWWCVQNDVPLNVAAHTAATMRSFLRYLQSNESRWGAKDTHAPSHQPASPRTQNFYHKLLTRFYAWLVDELYIDTSPMLKVRSAKYVAEQPDPFDEAEINRIAAVVRDAGDHALAERNRAIVAMLLDIGIRASELCGISTGDYDLANGDIVVLGKGGKRRRLRLGVVARRQMRRYWIRHRQARGDSGPFFLSAKGKALTRSGLWQLLDDVGAAADVDPCNPHRFRHTAAVTAIRAGMGEFQLQLLLGHTSLEMTRRYVKLVEADVNRAAREHSALDHLKLNF